MFLSIILVVVIMAVGATLLTKGTVTLMGRYGGDAIYRLHSSAEHIVRTHRVPPEWRERLEKRLRGLRDAAASPEIRTAHARRAKAEAIRRLDKLIQHFERTSLVADEEARDILTRELWAARTQWESAEWDSMVS